MNRRWKAPPPADSALRHADALQRAAAELGFDWPEIAPVWDKLNEELAELREAVEQGDQAAIEHELGDVLFSVVNLARFLGVDSDAALEACSKRFDQRLRGVQELLDRQGVEWRDATLSELENCWQQAKTKT